MTRSNLEMKSSDGLEPSWQEVWPQVAGEGSWEITFQPHKEGWENWEWSEAIHSESLRQWRTSSKQAPLPKGFLTFQNSSTDRTSLNPRDRTETTPHSKLTASKSQRRGKGRALWLSEQLGSASLLVTWWFSDSQESPLFRYTTSHLFCFLRFRLLEVKFDTSYWMEIFRNKLHVSLKLWSAWVVW